jgi:hypothetical protein
MNERKKKEAGGDLKRTIVCVKEKIIESFSSRKIIYNSFTKKLNEFQF